MSLKGFKCPAHGEEPGRNNDIRYCLTECGKKCTSPHVLFSILKNEWGDYHRGKRISATMLTGGCKRQVLLSRNIPFYIEPQRAVPAYRGRLIHLIAENIRDEVGAYGWDVEVPLELPCETESGKWLLTATVDAIDYNQNTIYDIKTLQDYAIQKLLLGKNEGTWSDHIPDQYVIQLNIYRYIAKKLDLIDAEKIKLQIMTFRDLIVTGNKQIVGLKKGFKWTKEEYDIPDVPILSDSEIEKIIALEGNKWYKILFAGEQAPVVDKDWNWLCKICAFKGTIHCPNPEEEREGRLEGWLTENFQELRKL